MTYFVVEMPLDKDGQGPASEDETIVTYWQIWNLNFDLMCEYATKEEADHVCGVLNHST